VGGMRYKVDQIAYLIYPVRQVGVEPAEAVRSIDKVDRSVGRIRSRGQSIERAVDREGSRSRGGRVRYQVG
jgi:hypothetical protein